MQYLPRASRYGRRRKGINFKRLATIVALAVFLIAVLACIRYYSLFSALKAPAAPALWRPKSGERIQFLLLGRLNGHITGCTLISIPAAEQNPVYIVRIPPATLSDSSAPKTLADVFGQNGIKAGIASLDELLANKMPINHYVVYDVQGITSIVAAMEKVNVSLPEGFQVRYGNTDYIFAAGDNKITAANITPFIASGSTFEDKAFWAEKSLLVAVFNELFSLNHISYFVRNLESVSACQETDLSTRELARFRDTLQALDWAARNYIVLPGHWQDVDNQRCWAVDSQLIQVTLRQIGENIPGYDKSTLVVDVFNANGIAGFAGRTADKLRQSNYTVAKVDNTELSEFTSIYYREGYLLAALEISLFLDVDAILVEDHFYDSDNPVAIILGLDLEGR